MKNKKIVDYIVVNGGIPEENLLIRIKNKISKINKEKSSISSEINDYTVILKNHNELLKELNKFEIGKEYKSIAYDEKAEWENKFRDKSKIQIANPLYFNDKVEKSFVLGERTYDFAQEAAFKIFKKSITSIKEEISNLEYALVTKTRENKELDEELKKYESDLNPTTNSIVKEIFEKQVLELVKMGYEPLGGVSVSRDISYQAMVKYEA
jgi:peptidoglycan hydrolase CwlO-like protein